MPIGADGSSASTGCPSFPPSGAMDAGDVVDVVVDEVVEAGRVAAAGAGMEPFVAGGDSTGGGSTGAGTTGAGAGSVGGTAAGGGSPIAGNSSV